MPDRERADASSPQRHTRPGDFGSARLQGLVRYRVQLLAGLAARLARALVGTAVPISTARLIFWQTAAECRSCRARGGCQCRARDGCWGHGRRGCRTDGIQESDSSDIICMQRVTHACIRRFHH